MDWGSYLIGVGSVLFSVLVGYSMGRSYKDTDKKDNKATGSSDE